MDNVTQIFKGIRCSRIRNHIEALQGVRHPLSAPAGLEQAADYIRKMQKRLGYQVTEQDFLEKGARYRNLIATQRGAHKPDEHVLVLAHYDTVAGSPGADDNASGVAVMLELAEVLKGHRFQRTLHFVAVPLEESSGDDPSSGLGGSRALAGFIKENRWNVAGVVVLESVAFAGEDIVQTAPPGLPFKVSEVGNFIAVVGNEESIGLVLGFAEAIDMHEIPLPYLMLAVTGNGETLPDTRRSDHAPFWDLGYKAVMVTDTTNFRNPNYHLPTDTVETLNLPFAAEVCRATAGLIMRLADLRK